MSRVTKWKLEKAKIKVVFRLQFHATNIPQSGWEKLFISFIPTETGKATAKTSKVNVRNGTCKWADPIYETTRLLLDSKNKLYDDKLYKLVVGMGTSRSSILGEATINLADYADASEPSAIALLLHGSDSGTILHVNVQLLTGKTGFREFTQQRDKGLQSGNNVNTENEPSIAKSSSSELQIPDDEVNKARTQLQLSPQSKELHEEYSDSQVTCDGSSNASESYYVDKLDSSSTHEVDSIKSRVSEGQTSPTEKRDDSDHQNLAIAYEENHRLRGSLEVAESSISELKLELSALENHANEMGTETQKFAQELATEIASGQELAKEVKVLKSECSKFKNNLEHLKEMKSGSKLHQTEHQKQLRLVNGVLLVEDQIKELQEKIYIGFRESDLSFLNSDLEVLLRTVQDLKKGSVEELPLQHEPKSMLHLGEIPTLPLKEPGSIGEIDSTEGTHLELLSQLDIAKAERESLVRKMDQMECYYEALVQELEENQKRILGEFQSLRNEHSTCLYTISTCKAETESIRNDMNDQMSRFADEKRDLGSVNTELQRRATTSESALKRARLNYSIAVSQLQKDLDMLSFQVLSMFETNQNVIKEAFSDTSQQSSQVDADLVDNLQIKPHSSGDILSGDLKKSLSLQENIYKKVEEELGEMCSANLYLDVYSGTLKEILIEASAHIRKTKEKLEELARELELSNQSRDVLFARLKTAAEDVHALNAENAYYLSKCNDFQLQNQMLEVDLGSVSKENFLLMEKITECEALLMDYRVYKSKHEVVSAEKLELESLLEIQVLDNQNLQKDMVSMKEELETLRSGNHELTLSKENIQKERDMAALSLSAARSEIVNVKMKFKKGLHDTVAKLDMPNASLEKLQLQLDSVANKFKSSLESEERHVQNHEVLLTYLSSLELELHKMSSEDKNFVEQIMGLATVAEELEKSKLTISQLKQQNQDLMMFVENKSEDSTKLLSELERLKESLRSMNDELDVERFQSAEMQELIICEDLKVTVIKTQYETRIEELMKQLQVSSEQLNEVVKKNLDKDLKLTVIKTQYETRIEELMKLQVSSEQLNEVVKKNLDKDARLNQYLASEAHYVEEKEELTKALKSLKTELEASVAQNLVFSDSINVVTCELEQYKDKVGVLEARLNHCLENEARYIKENGNLGTELESLKLELEASIAHNAEILESNNVLEQWKEKAGMLETCLTQVNNEHALDVAELKDMLAKSDSEIVQYRELQIKLNDTEARLNRCLENEARYIQENGNMETELESLRLESEASIARNAEISELNNVLEQWKDKVRMLEISLTEVNNQHSVEAGRLKDMLAKSEAEVGPWKELEMKLHDTETRLNDLLENEARYIEENEKLSVTLESVRLELKASIAHNAEVSESNDKWKDKVGMLEISLMEVDNEHALEVAELKDMLAKSDSEIVKFRELQMKLNDTEARLKSCLENEAHFIQENGNFATKLESLRLELEASIAHNSEISEANSVLQQWKEKAGMLENSLTKVNNEHALEVAELKDMLAKSDSEIMQFRELQMKLNDTEARLNRCLENEARYIQENGNLATKLESLRLELEESIPHSAEILENEKLLKTIESLRLENNKQLAKSVAGEESEIVLLVLKAKLDEQNNELTILQNKCSELANKLSEQILKTEEFKNLSIYLKELKDSGDVAREKREPEGPSESLRMAFIKEQYQTKIQELKQQLSVSKRHGEEMLFKLQDALDEIESRKKSEASQLRRIKELEAEVQLVTSDKPDYDRIQAELECALLSLECCKEEKEKLVALLKGCEEEKSKITVELSLIKEQLAKKEENGYLGDNGSMEYKEVASSNQIGEAEHSVSPVNALALQGVLTSESVHGVTERAFADEENSLPDDSKQLTVVNDQFRAQHLRSYMEQLDEELEKMKNDNSLLTLANYDPSFQDLQRELAQLRKANEELGSIYPNFVDFPGNGNALERVLALEIELAEALRAKKKSSIQFQSSFLKQHSDEEAVFKSFRDINELIKDMLEIKEKNVNVESELKEMHDRYSQLSLQFAEVEGERQKLMMTLKNVRSSRNLLRLNRSSMAAIEDHPL